MKRFFVIVLVVFAGIGSWAYFKGGCSTCRAGKERFFFIVSPPGVNAGLEKAAAALKQEYPHFRVVLWDEEMNKELFDVMEKYPYKFQRFKAQDKAPLRFYRLIHSLPPEDVVVMISPELTDPKALVNLNKAYSQKKITHTKEKDIVSFSAALFHQIKLDEAWVAPDVAKLISSLPNRLDARPKSQKADLVVFSYDRPLQLYAFLESLEKFVTNLGEVTVLYRTSNLDYAVGYDGVKTHFPKIHFQLQGQKPKKDFKPKLLKAAFQTPNPYLLFGVDDIVIREPVDLAECIRYIERTGALGFYLRLGTNTDYCNGPQLKGRPEFQGIPPSFALNDQVFAWRFQDGKDDWRYPHTADMTLYRKKDLKADLKRIDFNNPNTFECQWAQKARLDQVGLYYRFSKIVNLPLNLVNTPEDRVYGVYTAAQLMEKFKAGLKLDIRPLEKFRNTSAHTDFDVSFIPRGDD